MQLPPSDFLMQFDQVSFRYGSQGGGLEGCTLAIPRGSRNALLGTNGSGKTTLMQHAIGLLRPQGGQVCFDGAPVDYSRAGLSTLRRQVGMVFQNPDHQLFSASVIEDVSFGPLNLGLDTDTVRQRVADALAQVGMTDLAERPVHQLSFGQKKRVCIAGVLAMDPALLMLDEPMAGLDAPMQQELLHVLDGLAARGITILLSTHDVDFAYRWADHIHIMAGGRCTASFASAALPDHALALQQAGQSLPQVLRLQAALAGHGLTLNNTAPRSLEQLLAHLSAGAESAPGAEPITERMS